MISLVNKGSGYAILANGKPVGYAKMVSNRFSNEPTHKVYRAGLGFLGLWSIKDVHRYFTTVYS